MGSWQSREVLAWTRHDGPGSPPPAPPRLLALILAGGLAVVFGGLMMVDTLCPDHRAWVEGVATGCLLATVCAIVALWRSHPAAGSLTLLSTLGGVAIGVIDMAHDPTRGRAIALLFVALMVGALALGALDARLRWWERATRMARGTQASAPEAVQVSEPSAGTAEPAEPHDAAEPTVR